MNLSGGVAQLGERGPCKAEVSGSIPLISIIVKKSFFDKNKEDTTTSLNLGGQATKSIW